jgi:hypothetical protein
MCSGPTLVNIGVGTEVRFGSRAAVARRRMAQPVDPQIRKYPFVPALSLRADIVAKVKNRTTLKISRKLIIGLRCCCVAFNATTEIGDRFSVKR